MIKIAVIDDEENMLDIIQQCVKDSVDLKDTIKIYTYTDAETFLEQIDRGFKFQVLLTDIELKGLSGVELGKYVRKNYPKLSLIFLTSHAEFAAESYAIEAYQYILKQDMDDRLPVILNQLIEKIIRESKMYTYVGTSINKQKLYYNDIIYICKDKGGKYVRYIATNGVYRERTTLNKVLEELQSKEFILVERGYIVNMKHIISMKGNTIYLENKEQVMISRGRYTKVKEQINLYWRKV